MKYTLFISTLFISSILFGQNQLHTKRAKYVEAYQEAKSLVEVGNLYQSAEILNDILSKDESFDEAIMLLHEILLKRKDSDLADQTMSKYIGELEPIFQNRLYVLQAKHDYQLGKYQAAKENISRVNGKAYLLDSIQINILKNSIEFSINQVENPLQIDFQKLPPPLNKFSMQYFPSISSSGLLVYTMRDQLGRGDENLFTSQLQEGQWTDPQDISFQINSERNEGTASISADGKTLVFTSCNRLDNIGSCDLYISYFENGEWTNPLILGTEVNSTEWDSQPSLSADGKTLYFVSLRPGGFGKQDIWVSEKRGDHWTAAQNLGETINTPEDDISPFIYLDGKTLIFSTQGRIGLGGFDLYKTINLGGTWSEPENLGYPINDAFDQIGYCIAADQWAYFSSSEIGGGIFLKRFKVPNSIVPPVYLPIESLGQVVDAATGQRIPAQLWMISEDSLELKVRKGDVFKFKDSDIISIGAKSDGYRMSFVSKEEFLKDSTIRLKPFVEGEELLDKPILFSLNSAVLESSMKSILDQLIEFLQDYPELKIEVRGYTDGTGTIEGNLKLSQQRALTVADFLIQNLGPDYKIQAIGLGVYPGQDNSLKRNSSHRRVEIVVAGMN